MNIPNSLGLSPDRLKRLTCGMAGYVERGQVAGLVSLVSRFGEIAALESFGHADIESGRQMQPDTLFRIYSMTKPITSVAVLMLLEEGRFRLSDSISDYLPMFRGADGASSPITITQLLTHTSGLSYGFENTPVDKLYQQTYWRINPAATPRQGLDPVTAAIADLTPAHTQPLEATVAALATLPPVHTPGARFHYSVATDVLGLLVEKVSGMTLPDFFHQRIFEPLGMPDTAFYVPPAKKARLSTVYRQAEEGKLAVVDAADTSPFHQIPLCPLGGSGLVSTAADFLRFAGMLMGKGEIDGTRLLGRKTVELMLADHLPAGSVLWGNPAIGLGLGVAVQRTLNGTQTLSSPGTFNWGGAATTDWWADPQEQLIGIILVQLLPSTCPVTHDHRLLTYQSLVD